MNPNTPVIVGIAQILNRDDDVDDALEPVDMMVEAVREAALDTGSSAILKALSGGACPVFDLVSSHPCE